MKQAESQMNIEVVVGVILAVCFSAFVGYMIGLDHAETEYALKARINQKALPNKCLCGLTENKLRSIVLRNVRQCERKA